MKIESKLSNQTVYFTELTVKEYKNFLKETYGDDLKEELFIESVYNLLQNCLQEPLSFIKSLNAIDLLCLIIDIRINSIGDSCEILLNTGAPKPTNVELNLELMKQDLLSLNTILTKTMQMDNVLVTFSCPSLERFFTAKDEYLSFINKITVRDKFLKIETNEQAELVFDSLNPRTSLEIINCYKETINTLIDYNLLERYGIFEQKINFIPSIATFMWFVKLLFNESLQSFFTTFFHMSYTAHMDANYLESITVGEYKYFVNCLKETIARANQKEDERDGG